MEDTNHQETLYRDAVRTVDDARQELIALTGRFAELDVPLRNALRDRYDLTFGALLIRADKLRLEDRRQRLRLDAIRAVSAESAAVDRDALHANVQKATEDEAAAIRRAEKRLEQTEKAHRMAGLVAGQTKEHVRLIRDIVGKWSPQLYPGQDEAKEALFLEAREAFEEGDVIRLQMLHAMSRQIPMPGIHGSLEELEEEALRLQELIREMRARLLLMMEQFPFSDTELLEDEKKAEREKERILGQIRDLQQSIAYHRRIAAELLGPQGES
mgnify:FL=1